MSSPGATRNRYLSLFCSWQTLLIRMQASPGVLEKSEIVLVGPAEPTIRRLSGAFAPLGHEMSVVCCTASLPAALTSTKLSLSDARMGPQSADNVQPGTPSEALITVFPFLSSLSIPAATSCQLPVPV